MISNPPETHRAPSWKTRTADDYEAFIARLSVKGRATVAKHDELCDAGTVDGHGELWKRLAGVSRLAPHATEMEGQQSVKFYIRDGKYRQQVFALEDSKDGAINVYLPDVLAKAVEKKILAGGGAIPMYKIPGDNDTQVQLEIITAETRDMTACKAMVSWGKRALRTPITVATKEKSLRTVELLCELAAEAWPAQTPAIPGQHQV
jgi:hypothetical protein